jgi:kynurenine formamidase
MPQWPSKLEFKHHAHMSYHQDGYLTTNLSTATGVGTHVDSPAHFYEGMRSIDQLTLEELYCPAVVIDIEKQSIENADYTLQYQDLKEWIHNYGPIPKGALVIAKTGWFNKWSNPEHYTNLGSDQKMHFPGFSAQAAEFLLDLKVAGIAIDTFSLDHGVSEDFPVHKIMLGANKYQIENIANLDKLPTKGAYVLTCPIPILGAPEAFAKVLGLIAEK